MSEQLLHLILEEVRQTNRRLGSVEKRLDSLAEFRYFRREAR